MSYNWSLLLISVEEKYFYFLALVRRQSTGVSADTQQAMSQKWDIKWEIDITKFHPTLLYEEYCVNLKKKSPC